MRPDAETVVGVVGLGAMGGRLADRLAGEGGRVLGHDPFGGTTEAERVDDLAALVEAASVLLLVLPTAAAVRGVAAELAPLVGPDHVLVNHSTVAVRDAVALGSLAGTGCRVLDAPFSGGTESAVAGTLTVFAGGGPDALRAAGPVLAAYASRVVACGPLGAGTTVKLLHQHLVAAHVVAAAETVRLAGAAGLAETDVAELLAGTAADSTMLQVLVARLAEGPGPVRGSTRILHKDATLVAEFAESLGTRLDLLPAITRILAGHLGTADADRDIATLAHDA
ncbi:NAD(P)-dependent oxidoreductase [Actinomadura decatromicini]|uniref:NAD(P)-dependent oxidoreductase n=1 Tax=Actinomadura decatromicini TaxID=2604572 RepID=A0A5D3F9M9_9ACTN|nr:NAD(P)-dependent oxidoreductase [Actinomadura decatromicini]TYK44546.1 NAD(P)-dependent oxidoreductase [Actinomadura decatromicini]